MQQDELFNQNHSIFQTKAFRYILVICIYIFMQFSPLLLHIFNPFTTFGWIPEGLTIEEASLYINGQWGFFSFLTATIFIVLITYKDFFGKNNRGDISADRIVLWTVGGIFLAFGAQMISNLISMQFVDISNGSENTNELIAVAKIAPLFIPVICIFAPVVEEIIFRGILFKTIADKTNFFVGVLVSALIFAVIHQDFTFLLSYFMMGFVFAYLYHKTKRLIVPIVAHATMNTVVTVLQLTIGNLSNDLQKQIQLIHFFL